MSFKEGCSFVIKRERVKPHKSNPMPKLEAGMVFDYKGVISKRIWTNVYINEKLSYSIDGETWLGTCVGKDSILNIYKPVFGCFNSIIDNLGEPIWTKNPKKTERQIKIEELEQKLQELKEMEN